VLDPEDVVAAKIIHQFGWLPVGRLQAWLTRLHNEHERGRTLLAELTQNGLISSERAERVRQMSARFLVAFAEWAYLRELEVQGVPSEERIELLAQVEESGHAQRLAHLLHEQKRFPTASLWTLEARARRAARWQEANIVAAYAGERFAGVGRPLVRDGILTEAALSTSNLFLDQSTRGAVLKAIAQRRLREQPAADPSSVTEIGVDNENATVDVDLSPFRLHGRRTSRPTKPVKREFIGDYRVIQCLGRGGMGAVYLADAAVGQMVAIKVLDTNYASEEDMARFDRETKISALVDHPGVVRLLDSGRTDDGLCYMVIPPYPGTSMRSRIKEGEVPLKLAFAWLEGILEALEAVHSAGVVHRDIKPGNVLILAGSDAVKLVDFGISRFYRDPGPNLKADIYLTAKDVVSGSPAFLAPESIVGGDLGPRTDLYAFGVLAFELLTGRVPFKCDTAIQYADSHLNTIPPSLAEVSPKRPWSSSLERLLGSLLAKDPKDRPPSASAVLHTLRGGLVRQSLNMAHTGGGDPTSSFQGFLPQQAALRDLYKGDPSS
jgi:hypothetical protein